LASTAHTVRDITQQKKLRRFELYVFPEIGHKPIGEVKSPDVFAIVRPLIIKNQLETSHRVRSDISGAFPMPSPTAIQTTTQCKPLAPKYRHKK
jgi:hypothetical protein